MQMLSNIPNPENLVFVFGSNEAGRHGKGAAQFAREHRGALYGQGFGRQGDSFGIPTKSGKLFILPLEQIAAYVNSFLAYAAAKEEKFQVTRIGCGEAKYRDEQIAPLFVDAPANCLLPVEWREHIPEDGHGWWAADAEGIPREVS